MSLEHILICCYLCVRNNWKFKVLSLYLSVIISLCIKAAFCVLWTEKMWDLWMDLFVYIDANILACWSVCTKLHLCASVRLHTLCIFKDDRCSFSLFSNISWCLVAHLKYLLFLPNAGPLILHEYILNKQNKQRAKQQQSIQTAMRAFILYSHSFQPKQLDPCTI